MILGVILYAVLSAKALGDGMFVWDRRTDLEEPTQKAVILHDNGVEDMILQVEYAGAAEAFGWIVPLPAKPDIQLADAEIFAELSQFTQRRDRIGSREAGTEGIEAVKVLDRKKIGPYDVASVQASDAVALEHWLKANGFTLSVGAKDVIADYVRRNWVFNAIRIDTKTKELLMTQEVNKGTLVPLLFTFKSVDIIYPLKISSLNNGQTDVLLYVLAKDAVVHPDFTAQAPRSNVVLSLKRMDLASGIDFEKHFFSPVGIKQLPKCAEALPRLKAQSYYLSKLRRVFKSEEMLQDIVLVPPESLTPDARKAFVRGNAGSDKDPVYLNMLLARVADEVVDVIAERQTTGPLNRDAYEFLAQSESGRAFALLETLASETEHREKVAEALRSASTPKAVPLLRKLVQCGDWNTELYACEGLRNIGSPESIGILIDLAKTKAQTPKVRNSIEETKANHKRRCALEALSKLTAPRLIGTYDFALTNGELTQDEVWFCLLGLQSINDRSAAPIVERVMQKETNDRNRELAKAILDKWK